MMRCSLYALLFLVLLSVSPISLLSYWPVLPCAHGHHPRSNDRGSDESEDDLARRKTGLVAWKQGFADRIVGGGRGLHGNDPSIEEMIFNVLFLSPQLRLSVTDSFVAG